MIDTITCSSQSPSPTYITGQGSPVKILQSTPTKAGPSAELREDFARVYKTTGLDVVAKEVGIELNVQLNLQKLLQ